jgi:chorismate mutase / prephenate dehydratase
MSKTEKSNSDKDGATKPKVGIIGGTSQFGQWFKFFFENNGCECLVAGRKTELTAVALAKACDIVIVSVPIRETAKVIAEVRDLLKPDALLCDFTSVKSEPLAEMIKRKQGGVLGMHPLFGPLVPSIKNQNVVFCRGCDNPWVDFLKRLFESGGGKVIEMKAEEHDRQMAMVQALTHFVNFSFARTMQEQKTQPLNSFSTPVFQIQTMLAGRVMGGNAPLYADIEIHNKEFRGLLKEYLAVAKRLADHVAQGDEKRFEEEFRAVAGSMASFIPIAQAKITEMNHLINRQPVEMKSGRHGGAVTGAVACLGPEGTFSHAAATKIFPSEKKFIFEATIRQIFKAVHNEEARYGVVPIENSSNGLVLETLDAILNFPLLVVGSYRLPIHNNLLGRTADLAVIKTIRSHIQPLGQCREWISANFPHAKIEPQDSTTRAILATDDPTIAFIGSEEAAAQYGLKVLAKNIEDNKNNVTEFYVIAKNAEPKLTAELGADKSLLIITVYDRPGVLRDILDVLYRHDFNLTKLHSRTSMVEGWDYYFFLEIDARPETDNFQSALNEIRKYCSIVRLFGTA